MPRVARHVFPNLPHHITQRGNRREDVFFNDQDKQFYLELLIDYCEKHSVTIVAYCLMDNHIHLILIPETEDGLQKVLKPLHMRYAQYINKQHGWTGHLWQGRFFSSALDEAHTYSAIRYVERNPVEAAMVEKAEDYKWSSAGFHCGLVEDSKISDYAKQLVGIPDDDWSEWLMVAESKTVTSVLERNVEKGLPCGSDSFIDQLEQKTNCVLRYRPQGRPSIKR
jgi:putative transposase